MFRRGRCNVARSVCRIKWIGSDHESMFQMCRRWTRLTPTNNKSTQLQQALIGHARSPASRHVDLLRTDWLRTLQQTSSQSSKHVNYNETVNTGVREFSFVWCEQSFILFVVLELRYSQTYQIRWRRIIFKLLSESVCLSFQSIETSTVKEQYKCA